MAGAMAAFVSYGRVSYIHEVATLNDREFDLLSSGAFKVFWDALLIELWPLPCFMVECHRIRRWRHESIENSICDRLVLAKSSAMPMWLELCPFLCLTAECRRIRSWRYESCILISRCSHWTSTSCIRISRCRLRTYTPGIRISRPCLRISTSGIRISRRCLRTSTDGIRISKCSIRTYTLGIRISRCRLRTCTDGTRISRCSPMTSTSAIRTSRCFSHHSFGGKCFVVCSLVIARWVLSGKRAPLSVESRRQQKHFILAYFRLRRYHQCVGYWIPHRTE